MKRPKIKKIVRKKIKSGKKLVKRTKTDASNKDMLKCFLVLKKKL